jgi:hypothetical protein
MIGIMQDAMPACEGVWCGREAATATNGYGDAVELIFIMYTTTQRRPGAMAPRMALIGSPGSWGAEPDGTV